MYFFRLKDYEQVLKKYTLSNSLPFTQINQEFLKRYETWYLAQFNKSGGRNSINGLAFRLKEIRRVYNLAINDNSNELSQEHYPFGRYGYSIKKERTTHRDLESSEIAKLFQLQLTPETKLWHHHNYFKFCFECWGMNFADLAFLRVYQIKNGILKYKRRKTRWATEAKPFNIELSSTAMKIADYYLLNKVDSDLVFPILENVANSEDHQIIHEQFRNKRSNHIRRLKSLAKLAGISSSFSTYVGRHSFFSIAQKNGVPTSVITELAGHDNSQTTETYLGGFKGDKLKDSAGIVQSAIGKLLDTQYEHETILDTKIKLSDTGREIKIINFLKNLLKGGKQDIDSTHLIVAILTQTNCTNGAKAQQYVDEFLLSKQSNPVLT
ncbi:MAG: tyrosine-type recombinase/integrase [Flavobacteriales bacterium]|nr:tyrosine-type recombinase/integrase [Flavobacteriales bacterium]